MALCGVLLGCAGSAASGRHASFANTQPPGPDTQRRQQSREVSPDGALSAAEGRIAAGDCPGAMRLLERIVMAEDAAPRAWFQLGFCREELGAHSEAMAAYRQTLARDERFAEAHNNLGRLQRLAGELNEAVHSFEQALALDPALRSAAENLALSLEDLGDHSRAKDAYRHALRTDSENGRLRANYGLFLLEQGEREEASRQLRAAITHSPDDVPLLEGLANGLRRLGLGREAAQVYRRAMELAERSEEGVSGSLLAGAALAEVARQRPEAALEFLQRAMRLDANDGTAIYLAARVHRLLEEPAAARALMERYLEVEPNGPHAGAVQRYLEATR